MTNHLSEEELILHYYGETDRAEDEAPRSTRTSRECGECQAAKAQLHRVLALVETAAPVEARPGFERDVWARLEPQLRPTRSRYVDSDAMRQQMADVLLVPAVGAGRRRGRAGARRRSWPAGSPVACRPAIGLEATRGFGDASPIACCTPPSAITSIARR